MVPQLNVKHVLTNRNGKSKVKTSMPYEKLDFPLYYLTWNVTNKCNLSCRYCYNENHTTAVEELNTKKAKLIMDEATSLGLKIILFTGGEPLLRKDIYTLLEYAKKQNLYVCLATNGTLIDDKVIQNMKGIVDKVNIGFSGLNTSPDGLYSPLKIGQRHFDMIAKLNKVATVCFNHTVHSRNLNELMKVAELCKNLEIELSIKRFVPTGIGSQNSFDLFYDDHKKLYYLVKTLQNSGYNISFRSDPIFEANKRNKNNFGGCLAGIHSVSVDAYGRAILCTKLPLPLADLREISLVDFWKDANILQKLRRRELNGKCGKCQFLMSCGGCRAMAYTISGNLLDSDPLCFITETTD